MTKQTTKTNTATTGDAAAQIGAEAKPTVESIRAGVLARAQEHRSLKPESYDLYYAGVLESITALFLAGETDGAMSLARFYSDFEPKE